MSEFEKRIPSNKQIETIGKTRDRAFSAITDIAATRREWKENQTDLTPREIEHKKVELELQEMFSLQFMAESARLTEMLQACIKAREDHPALAEITDELAELGTLEDYVKKTRLFGPVIAKIVDLDYLDALNDFDVESYEKPSVTWLKKFATQFASTVLMLQDTINSYKLQREELQIVAETQAILEDFRQ